MKRVAKAFAILHLLCTVEGQAPVHNWEFDAAGVQRLRGSIRGAGQVLQAPLPNALVFRSREDRVVIARSVRNARLPRHKITVAAWVMLDTPRGWGGLFSALQDNGGFEKGVLLGYRGSTFCFALASQGADDGDGKMTYVHGTEPFTPGRFQHVVGVYDDAEMTLYVDGKRQAGSKAQHGPILYPRRAIVELGAYHDDDEDFPFAGLLGSVRVWDVALDAAGVQREFAAGVRRFAMPSPATVTEHRFVAMKTGLANATPQGPIEYDEATGPPNLRLTGATSFATAIADLPRSAFSIEATFWLGGNRRRQSIVGAQGIELSILDGKLRFGVGKTVATQPSVLTPFRWHHAVATFDGSLMRLYLDGRSRTFARTPAQMPASQAQRTLAPGTTLRIATHLRGRLHAVAITNRVWTSADVQAAFAQQQAAFPKPLPLALGPFARFTTPSNAQIRWRTGIPAHSTWVEVVDPSGALQRVAVRTEDGTSVADVARLRPGTGYDYRILIQDQNGKQRGSATYRLDTEFSYATEPVVLSHSTANDIAPAPWLAKLPTKRGYAVVVGGNAKVAMQLVAHTELQVVVVEPDDVAARRLRETFAQRGLYGRRVSVLRCPFAKMSVGSDIANAVLVATPSVIPPAELERICRPQGGVVLDTRGRVLLTEGQRTGAGDWTHQYGSAANTAASGDDLVDGPLELQWFGRPGPRPMMDRGCRAPAPLSTRGRLFIHGDRRLIAVDSYNGTILWSMEIPALRRTNMPRDCSNITARGDHLFAAVVDRLWRIDAQTGRLQQAYRIPEDLRPEGDPAWGFVHATENAVLGTATRVAATYRGAEGEWYDKPGTDAEDVLGAALFSLDKATGETRWSRRRGLIVHPTITLDKNVIYFVEDRKPSQASRDKLRLVDQTGTDQYLVALDIATGNQIWQRKYDFRKFQQVFYLSLSQGVLVSVGVSNSSYHTHAFDASTGTPMWQRTHKWTRNHHGGGVQHPVILNGVIYLEFKGIDLQKGDIVRNDLPPRRGCGTMSGSGKALFFRHYDHTMWNPETNVKTTLPGIRSGCWLSLIPAEGLLLAPESSSGCSCTNPIQTSVAYRPKHRVASRPSATKRE